MKISIDLNIRYLDPRSPDTDLRHDLEKWKDEIMKTVTEFAAAQRAANEKTNAAVNSIKESIQGVANDVQELKDKLDQINNSPGTLSASDQALLDDALAQADSVANQVQGAADSLTQLDQSTQPTVPS